MKEAKLRPIRLSMARNIPLKASKTVKRVRHPSSLASIGPWPCPGPRPATMLQKIVKIVSDRPRCWEQLRMLCPIRNQHSRHCKTHSPRLGAREEELARASASFRALPDKVAKSAVNEKRQHKRVNLKNTQSREIFFKSTDKQTFQAETQKRTQYFV